MLKPFIESHIVDIVQRLQARGFEAYIVGGAVRDFLIGRQPKDYDISTNATPRQIQKLFGRRRTFVIGRRFRIVHFHHGREVIEISTFRKAPSEKKQFSSKKKPGAPDNLIIIDNEYGTPYEDAWRRDFTVNAIFYDPIQDQIIDHTGMGIDDLEKGLVRTLGEPQLRFEEDPVRILRALKLVGQYGFKMTKDTEKSLNASLKLIDHCSHSRLSLELEKILKNPYGEKILCAFYKYGFLSYFLPFIHENWKRKSGKYMLQLLAERNKRLLSGVYRSSVSLAVATIALPFIEEKFGENGQGHLWQNRSGLNRELRKYVISIFDPGRFPKRLIASSVRMLILQPKFIQDNPTDLFYNRSYNHARELFLIQNNVTWKSKKLENLWPPKKRRRRKRRRSVV